jgi:hypothetical protein
VVDLIAEGTAMVDRDEVTMNGAARIIANREWPKEENLPLSERLANSKAGLIDQIRKGIARNAKYCRGARGSEIPKFSPRITQNNAKITPKLITST